MDGKRYPTSVCNFKALVSGEYHFVDKTLMIKDICSLENSTILYTRPRRFGKTLNLSMIDYYFNIEYKDEPNIFEGLKISKYPQCEKHRNAYPIIRLNFGYLKGTNLDEFLFSLSSLIADVAESVSHIDNRIKEFELDFLNKCRKMKLNQIELEKSVRKLCSILSSYYKKKVIILVDEYDSVIQKIHSKEQFDVIVEALGPFMEKTFKFNDDLYLGIVTGIMPLTKTSMLSSFNNASVRSILETDGDEFFGFTSDEIINLVEESGKPIEKIAEIKEWYDGYHFGDADVYNPYSVMNYLSSDCLPFAYWEKTTGGGISADLVSNMGAETLCKLKRLCEEPDYAILSPINTRISYYDAISPFVDPSVVYSYLAMTGYLKTIYTGNQKDGVPECRITIVNREVSSAFKSLVERADTIEKAAIRAIDSIYLHDELTLEEQLESMLEGISMDHTWIQDENPTARHNRYRDLIMAYLITPGFIANTEVPKGYGRTDIFFDRTEDHPPVIIEIKTTIDPDVELDSLAEEALKQIDRKYYSREPATEDAICMGVAIWMKKVKVKIK